MKNTFVGSSIDYDQGKNQWARWYVNRNFQNWSAKRKKNGKDEHNTPTQRNNSKHVIYLQWE